MSDDDGGICMFSFKELKLIAVPVQAAIWDRTQALCKRSYYYFCNPRPPFCSYCFVSGNPRREKYVNNRHYMQRYPISFARKQGSHSLMSSLPRLRITRRFACINYIHRCLLGFLQIFPRCWSAKCVGSGKSELWKSQKYTQNFSALGCRRGLK